MVPHLALSYNSQGGNGLLGMGWTLSGLSAVTRCSKTLIQDGAIAGINYTNTDKYCLDGQRLVPVTATITNPCASSIEYRTERESYTRVVSCGAVGTTGPSYFKVWTKSGQIIEFGNTADSKIEAEGKTAIRVWAQNKTIDAKGNYLTISYTEGNANGQYHPARIDYTGNAAAGLAPYNSVRFAYDTTRLDKIPLYEAGSLMKTTVRLINVQTYAKVNGADTMVKDYRLAYDSSAATQRSRLISLTECDGAGANCLRPTALGWLEGGAGRFAYKSSFSPYPQWGPSVSGDFNGDGKDDFMINTQTDGAGWYVYLSNGDGTFRFASSPTPYPQWNSATPGDFNGDGRTDFMINTATGGAGWYTYLANALASLPLPDSLSSISLGQNLSITLTYKPLTDSTVYKKDIGTNAATYPVQDVQAPIYVVSSVSSSNGIGGSAVSNYTYAGAKIHLRGGGFLGFREVKATDAQTGLTNTTTYGQGGTCVAAGQADSAYPYCLYSRGLPLKAEKRTASNGLLNQIINTWNYTPNTSLSAQYHAPKLEQSVEKSYDLVASGTGPLIATVTTCNSYDGYGNPTYIGVWTANIACATPPAKTGKHVKETTNIYSNDTVKWYLGRLTDSVITNTKP